MSVAVICSDSEEIARGTLGGCSEQARAEASAPRGDTGLSTILWAMTPARNELD
jgi:hypothetical protein